MNELSPYLQQQAVLPHRPRDVSLGTKTAFIVALVLLLAVANIVLVKVVLQEFNGVASIVNTAGRMRMLSQKIAYETLGASREEGSSLKENALRSIGEFEAAFQALRGGSQVFGADVPRISARHDASMDEVWKAWTPYRDQVLALLPGSPRPAATDTGGLSSASSQVLAKTEALVSGMVEESQAVQAHALRMMYALFVLDAVLLLGTYFTIRRYVVSPLQRLAGYCHQIALGNYDVRNPYLSADEIGQLGRALNTSASRIGELMTRLDRERQSLMRAEAMFRGLAENTVVGIYVVIGGGRFGFVSDKLAQMFGYEPDEMIEAVTITDIIHEDDLARIQDGIRRRLIGQERSGRYECKAVRKDGASFYIEVFGSSVEFNGENAMIGIMVDVTNRKEAEITAQQARLVYESTSEAIIITDPDGFIIDVNPAFTMITGYSRDEVIGERMSKLSSGRHDRAFYRAMWKDLITTGKWEGDIWNRRKDGTEYAEHLTINTAYDGDKVRCRIGLFSDVTEKRRSEAFIWRQAHYDHLTGLPNRQMFHDRLQQAMNRSKRSGRSMALVFLDLDLFKEVNDTLGHDMGDELLKQVANRLSLSVRKSDTVARLGGDEFTMIIEDLEDTSLVEPICRKFISILSEPFALGDSIAKISASIGVTFYPDDGLDMNGLLKNADIAMYASKERGRNQLCYFTPAMQEAAASRRQILRDLEGALDDNQFTLVYQPIVDLVSGEPRKAESLVRWNHPIRGKVSPAEFIPFAEDSGMIVGIGDWAFRTAARQLAQWRDLCSDDFQISVNVSPVQFQRGGVRIAGWLSYLRELGLPGQNMTVEITERLLLEVDDKAKNDLLMFRDAGIRVALDDFGTGYSSLSYLKRFDIDYIKIDQSFVRNLAPGSDDLTLCEAIIGMAHRLGLKVIAEGVETQEQHELLVKAGCDYGQGYLFSRPLPPDEFEAFLRANSASRMARAKHQH